MKKILAVPVLALSAFHLTNASEILFEYDGDYVESGQAFRLTADEFVSNSDSFRPFSERLTLNRIPGALYTGPDLFGGWEVEGDAAPVSTTSQIANRGDRDPLLFRFRNGSESTSRAIVLVMGILESPVNPSDLESFSFSAIQAGLPDEAEAQVVICLGDLYFISSESLPILHGSPPIEEELRFESLTWRAYDPRVLGEIGDPVELSGMFKVSRVGFRFAFLLPGGSDLDRSLEVFSIRVSGKALPE
jgi:hypothetical protein